MGGRKKCTEMDEEAKTARRGTPYMEKRDDYKGRCTKTYYNTSSQIGIHRTLGDSDQEKGKEWFLGTKILKHLETGVIILLVGLLSLNSCNYNKEILRST